MTSFRQIEANRRNALRSTGPTTEDGKRRARQNAVRHGLSAETIVEVVEDIDDYRGFEAAVIADYDARTAVERELVLRLASLLWRLRRATMIETDLLRIQAEVLRDRRSGHLAVRSRDTPKTARTHPPKQQAVLIPHLLAQRSAEVELTRRNIPLVKFGGLELLDAAHIEDVLPLLRFVAILAIALPASASWMRPRCRGTRGYEGLAKA
jgi:hypothetical protein